MRLNKRHRWDVKKKVQTGGQRMRFLRTSLIAGLIFAIGLSWLASASAERVRGYTRRDGTYVQSYERTRADGNPRNNYSYPGNYNPNTGRITGGSESTYLDNYYGRESGSNSESYWSTFGNN